MTSEKRKAASPSRRTILLAGVVAALALGAGAVYGIGFAAGNGETACTADAARLARLDEAAQGEVASMIVLKTPEPTAEMRFVDAGGSDRTLADWSGKVVLLNLWATWCVPCREEMPALDALQGELGGEDFEVVTVNLDRGGPEKPTKFFEDVAISHLQLYRDPEMNVFETLKRRGRAFGLPTTLLIDRDGCTIGHMPGPADWASEDAKALISAALAEKSG